MSVNYFKGLGMEISVAAFTDENHRTTKTDLEDHENNHEEEGNIIKAFVFPEMIITCKFWNLIDRDIDK
eukprot:snap_masked-scaffold_6-processed-gene-5.27-mRNA-1 protein AED:1.00 eAED:1.00 QI:0/0/0/0/1/1/2/0/68